MTFSELIKEHNLTEEEADSCYKYLISLRLTYEDIQLLNQLRTMTKRIFK